METTETEPKKEYLFDEFKKQLHDYIKTNHTKCSRFLQELLEAENEKEIKMVFVDFRDDVYDHLGGDFSAEEKVEDLEDDIRHLENKISELEDELETKDGALDGTLNGEYKFQHFINYKNEYSESELEELLKNGKKYLKNEK